METISSITDRIMGCLYGQAIGNALGAFCEDMSKAQIKSEFKKSPNTPIAIRRGKVFGWMTIQIRCSVF